jgi:EAL domain-containing protein (putative c-di-GMP-specific phosphodiesterase class I)
VEEEATLDMLARLGCDLAQGYFIARPMPASELVLGQRLVA